MVFGGIWGGVAWGAWFLWDPKFIWSVILWFHYASFIHLRMTPSLASAERLRVGLAWLGCLWILVAWVGTSFFFGGSSHAF
jgi:ABC-type transport system involved in cytochrome c biogenesis permease subunit